eukprot:13397015-Ditylum_brightwellii.AAC.1
MSSEPIQAVQETFGDDPSSTVTEELFFSGDESFSPGDEDEPIFSGGDRPDFVGEEPEVVFEDIFPED